MSKHDKGAHGWFRRVSGEEAEKIAGCKLDKRIAYFTPTCKEGLDWLNGCKLAVYSRFTIACSGCSGEEEYSEGIAKGCGCPECGYTGKRRDGEHMPFIKKEK